MLRLVQMDHVILIVFQRNLACVLNGKRYGLAPSEIERNLIVAMKQ